jgi:hypothetical protein
MGCTASVSSEAVNRRRVMDQPPTPARYLACNREAPRCGGGDLGRHEGPRCGGARRLICSLSNGETRSGAGRRPCFLLPRDIPLHGEAPAAHPSKDGSAQTGRLGRRDGRKRIYGAAEGPPFPFPQELPTKIAGLRPGAKAGNLSPFFVQSFSPSPSRAASAALSASREQGYARGSRAVTSTPSSPIFSTTVKRGAS